MCHAWIAHWTVARATLTMSRRRSTRDERTHGRNACEPLFGAHVSPFGALSARIRIMARVTYDERANQRTEHGERSTYQIKCSQHIPVILHMRIEF